MEEYPSFMTCILRIKADKSQKTIDKVLQNVYEVTNCRMNRDGMIEISGTVYPNKFLKMLRKSKKKVELCHFQFGECSSNLFLPSRPVDYGITNKYGGPNNMLLSSLIGQKEAQPGYFGGRDGRFLHYGDKPSQLKKSKDSSKEKSHHDHVHGRDHSHNHNHNHVHGRDHSHNHNHSHVHGRDHNHNHNHVHGRDHNHNHNHNQNQNHVHGRDHNHNHNHGCDDNHNGNHNHVHGHDHNHNHVHDKERDYRNHDQVLHVDGGKGKHVEWEKHERKLEHAAGCINATTTRPKVQLDCEKQMKGRAKPLKSQGVNSCCLM